MGAEDVGETRETLGYEVLGMLIWSERWCFGSDNPPADIHSFCMAQSPLYHAPPWVLSFKKGGCPLRDCDVLCSCNPHRSKVNDKMISEQLFHSIANCWNCHELSPAFPS